MHAEALKQHQWLQQLVGSWTYESACPAEPGAAPQKYSGTENVRSLGGLWVLAEGEGEMPGGGTANMLMTIGYDPQRKSFVGTWVGSMMTHLWVYHGELDAAGRVLTLSAEGPRMGPEGPAEGTARYRDVIEVQGPDSRTLTSYMQGDDGTWQQIMQAQYRRQK